MGYAETRGSPELREAISSLYPECGPENILVTTGTSEANFLAALGTMERDARVVTVLPNYMQVWGLATSLGCRVEVLRLREEAGWQPLEEDVKEVIGRDTLAVSLSNPNNPTGIRLTDESRKAIVDAASDAGAWILSDEVYRGAERDGEMTRSFWSEHDRVLVTSGLSKAFGLPGLRVGWICGPQEAIDELWSLHDYTTIALSKVTEALGTLALARRRDQLISRARDIIRRNFPYLEAFVERAGLSWVPPEAGAIAFIGYPWRMPSEELARMALARDILIVPGSHFHEEGHIRLGFGMETDMLEGGLRMLEALLQEVAGR
jgi:aspartate/methionine/tyrosine aminotransferase